MRNKRLIIGISGASGVIYGIRILELLKETQKLESHLIITPAAEKNIELETDFRVEEVKALADHVYDIADQSSSIASGTFQTAGMVVIPCSIKTLSAISSSYNDNLLIRAADVTLKEGRKLVLVPRETPLHKGHLTLMQQVVENGATILPPIPGFYFRPRTVDDIVNHTVGKVLDQFQVPHSLYKEWNPLNTSQDKK